MSYSNDLHNFQTKYNAEYGREGMKVEGRGYQCFVMDMEIQTTCISASTGVSVDAAKVILSIVEKVAETAFEVVTDGAGEIATACFDAVKSELNDAIAPQVASLLHDMADLIPGSGESLDNFYATLGGANNSPTEPWNDIKTFFPFRPFQMKDVGLKISPPYYEREGQFMDISGNPNAGVSKSIKFQKFGVPFGYYGRGTGSHAHYDYSTREKQRAFIIENSKFPYLQQKDLFICGFDYDYSSQDDLLYAIVINPFKLAIAKKLGPMNDDPNKGWDPFALTYCTTSKNNSAVYSTKIIFTPVKPEGNDWQ